VSEPTEPPPEASQPRPAPSGPDALWQRVTGPDTRAPGPIVRLPTWVNIVLVLILFASCGAADETRRAFTDDGATRDDVRHMCRLLGAVAQKHGMDPTALLNDGAATACREGLQVP
jgi:hypothetical protein